MEAKVQNLYFGFSYFDVFCHDFMMKSIAFHNLQAFMGFPSTQGRKDIRNKLTSCEQGFSPNILSCV